MTVDDFEAVRTTHGFTPGRWYRVVGRDGTLWLETINRSEAIGRMRTGDTLQRLWCKEEFEWREEFGPTPEEIA